VRSDSNLNKKFTEEGVDVRQYGRMPGVLDTSKKVDGKPVLRSHSFSGNEGNSVFLNHGGMEFEDVSGVTGIDSLADGRAFSFFDYDRDGRSDLVLTNTNYPQLQLFRNELKDAGRVVKVRLVGGNREAKVNKEWSARDGYGAHVLVTAGGMTQRRELRAGDGFATQNSDTLVMGIGKSQKVEGITVLWPSGKKSVIGEVAAGTVVTVFENAKEGEVKIEREAVAMLREVVTTLPKEKLALPVTHKLNVVMTMTTWCPVCRGEIPHLRRLQKNLSKEVGFYGLPVDAEDDRSKLQKFQKEVNPPYVILDSMSAGQREAVEALMKKSFGEHPLPTTLILDDEGNVLESMKGTPSLSQVRLLLSR
jgi:thiol-disulfide isomerase/thioredoxin|tara:strand:+ start:2001 stop:3089 length:1089 start_codon:yes stop_codon:yes gene_type:complete